MGSVKFLIAIVNHHYASVPGGGICYTLLICRPVFVVTIDKVIPIGYR